MSYCIGAVRTLPDQKPRASQSPRSRVVAKPILPARFISDPAVQGIPPFPQSNKHANHKPMQQYFEKDPKSRSPVLKDNHVANRSSYKQLGPSVHDQENTHLRERLTALEKQITAFMSENKQLTKVLDQQIQINQTLKEQLRVKTHEAQSLEQKASSLDDEELKSIIDQLQIYKQIVESLEVKINNVVQENNRLNECLEQSQLDNEQLRQQLKGKVTTFTELTETYKLKEENQMLRQNIDNQEREMQEMRNHIEMFKQHIMTVKGALTPQSLDRQQYEEKHHEAQRLQQECVMLRQQLQQHEHAIRYQEQIMGLDQQKLKNLEEKLMILEKENIILKSSIKN